MTKLDIKPSERKRSVTFREPTREDGAAVWELIRSCEPLDENSMYCNLVQCDHFASTCVLAERGGDVVGWISAYVLPEEPDTLFVWQVAVGEKARGLGVAKRMLTSLLDRPACTEVTRIKTTITRDNEASWALFTSFAEGLDAPLTSEPHYEREVHFDGRHATEHMVTIGAFGTAREAAA